jgi:Uncharacterized protein family UPF0004
MYCVVIFTRTLCYCVVLFTRIRYVLCGNINENIILIFSEVDVLYFTDNKLDADLWLLNSCTVKNPAEDHFRNEITSARKLGKYIVLAGCVPQGQPKSDYVQVSSTIPHS